MQRLRATHLVFALVALGAMAAANAQVAANTAQADYSGIIDQFRTAANAWGPALQQAATVLYGSLITISLVLTFMPMALRGAEINEWAETLFRFALVTGFWLWMIHNFSTLADDIIKGFWHAGQNAAAASGGNTRLDPWDVVSTGLNISASVARQAHLWNLGPAIVIGLSALVILVVFALLAGVIAITLVEAYVIINAAVIFIALAGFQFSAEIARHAIRYVIGIGAKLFALQLIIGVASAVFQNWSTQFNAAGTVATIPDALALVALVVLVFYLANSVPSALMGIVTGAHGTGQSIGSMVAAGATAMTMGAGAAMTVGGGALKGAGGTINAVHGGSKLASEQLRDATLNGTAPTSKLERFGVAAGATAANVAWAATKDIGARLGGRPNHGGGSMGGRMGDAMRSQAADKNAARERPSSPSSAATGTDGGTIRGATSDGNSK
jgi:type IV secretion system protein TrbL